LASAIFKWIYRRVQGDDNQGRGLIVTRRDRGLLGSDPGRVQAGGRTPFPWAIGVAAPPFNNAVEIEGEVLLRA
jgi:hypothetical protein